MAVGELPGSSKAWQEDQALAQVICDEVASLGWTYVSRLQSSRRPSDLVDHLARLGGEELAFLRDVRFCMSPEVQRVVLELAPVIIRQLPQSTRTVRETRHEARGRVDWPATIRERLATGDRTCFAVSRAAWHFDVPENRALVFLLERIAQASRAVSMRPRGQIVEGRRQIAEVGIAAERLRRNSQLSSVPSTASVSNLDRQAVRASRRWEFREAVSGVLDLHSRLYLHEDLGELKRLLGDQVWLPPEPDRIFELWVFFTTVNVLEGDGWAVERIGLLGAGVASAGFRLRKDSHVLHVGFQSLPGPFLASSKYTDLIDTYSLDGSSRRPDVVLTLKSGGNPRYLIIEAKLTSDRDYITDSIYKVLGYVSDFAESMQETPNPKGVLVVWSGVRVPETFPAAHPIALMDVGAMRGGRLTPIALALAST